MSSCSEVDRLFDAWASGIEEAEVSDHVAECESCREDLLLLRFVSGAFAEKEAVPGELVRRTKALILVSERRRVAGIGERASGVELLVTGVLGALTSVAVVVGSGVPVGAGIGHIAGYSVVLAAVAVVFEVRRGRSATLALAAE